MLTIAERYMTPSIVDKLYDKIHDKEKPDTNLKIPKKDIDKNKKWTLKMIIDEKPVASIVREFFREKVELLNEDSDIEDN